jgi:hypothetical protein
MVCGDFTALRKQAWVRSTDMYGYSLITDSSEYVHEPSVYTRRIFLLAERLYIFKKTLLCVISYYVVGEYLFLINISSLETGDTLRVECS